MANTSSSSNSLRDELWSLEAEVANIVAGGGGGVPTSSNLAQVLANGNDGSGNSITGVPMITLGNTAPLNNSIVVDGAGQTITLTDSLGNTNVITAIGSSSPSTNADNVKTTATTSSATFYPALLGATTGYNSCGVDVDLTYVPSTNTLSLGSGEMTITKTTGGVSYSIHVDGKEVEINDTQGKNSHMYSTEFYCDDASGNAATITPLSIAITNGVSATTITGNSVTSTTFNGNLSGTASKATNLAGGVASQIPYQSGVDTTAFIANGTSGQYLKSNGAGAPSWDTLPVTATPTLASVMTAGNKASTTLDMSGNNITNAANVTATTFIGDLSGNAVSATKSSNLAGGVASQIPYQSGANTTAFIANGTSGQYLKSNGTGAPSWDTLPVTPTPSLASVMTAGNKASTTLDMSGNNITNAANVTATTFIGDLSGNAVSATKSSNLAGGVASQIPYQSGANTTAFIANGTSGQYLKSNGTGAPSWDTLPVTATPTLSSVLTAGNTATNSIILNNGGTHVITTDPSLNTIVITDGTTTNTIDKNGYTTRNTTTNSTHYLNFSDSSSTGTGAIQKTAGISVNPSTKVITATSFAGDLSGNATNATNTSTTLTTTAGTYYPVFVSNNVSGNYPNLVGVMTYNPSTNTITANTFNGVLSGTATNATNVGITADNTNGTYYLPFAKTSGTGNKPLFIDDTTTPLTYNPSTGTLTATTFVGDLSGNAVSATRATNIAGGLGGQIPYQSAVNTTALLANGTAGQVLTSQGTTLAPTWTTISSGSNATTINITDTNASGTYYPTFVSGSGSTQTLRVDASNNPLSYNPSTGRLTTENMYIGTGTDPAIITNTQIQKFPSDAANSSSYTIFAQNNAGLAGTAYTEIRSGNPSNRPRIEQVAYKYNDFSQQSYSRVEDTNFDIATAVTDDVLDMYGGVRGFKDASLNSGFPVGMLSYFETNNAGYNSYTGVRVYDSTIEMFSGATKTATANIASFLVNSITLNQPLTLTQNSNSVANFTDLGITFSQNLVFPSNKGMRLNSFNQGNGTGTTNLSRTTDQFRTAINTPTASGRVFVLPVPVSPDDEGIWYGICNKSTSFTIAVQYPAGTLIATIPVATNATHGGSFARFAVGNGSINYYRCG